MIASGRQAEQRLGGLEATLPAHRVLNERMNRNR